ncbi:DC-STAMP domain-containing protein 2-like [Ruditapes philippinarum]|uniref:DC-STAMP domain-containing protein 2-like n=1 Tax=Ruditapes philippinarum TaxID=129788 RepID=UPI00295B0DBB|nr:DC-STAMP domain-containing protein 2-like [Ruditapes philippinarum]
MACVLGIAINQTKALQLEMSIPSDDLRNYVRKQNEERKALVDKLESAFGILTQTLDLLDDGSATTESVKCSLQKSCGKIVILLQKTCNIKIRAVEQSMQRICDEKCDAASKFLYKECYKIYDHLRKATLDDAINFFKVDMVISGEFSGNANVSKPATAIQHEVEKDIGGKLNIFDSIISTTRFCVSLSLFLIFLKTFWYLRNYLAKDGYDNIYITKQFKQMDKEAGENGRETVLPLKPREREEYVDTVSFKLNSTELSYSKLGLIQVLLHFLLCVLIVSFDYALYYMLNMVKEYGNLEIEIKSSGRVKIDVNGDGPVAEFYKLLVNPYNLDRSFNRTLDIEPCLPEPRRPSGSMIPVFIVLYIIALAVVLLRAYGMRLRRKVSAYYCPEQELARLDYLHKKIRHRRVGFLKFLRQQIKSAHKEDQVKNQLRFSTWLAFNFPILAQILPKKEKLECTSCGQRDTSFNKVQLTKCTGEKGGMTCDAVYCEECFTALQKTCPLCSMNENVVLRE